MKRNAYIFGLLITIVVLSGCAGTVTRAVKEQNKDPAGNFDGDYIIIVKHPGGRQDMGNNWYNDCSAQDFRSELNVENSEVQWRWNNNTVLRGFVDSAGRFRIDEPLKDERAKSGSTILADNSISVILQGVLEEDTLKGVLMYGLGQFNGRGCSYPVKYDVANN